MPKQMQQRHNVLQAFATTDLDSCETATSVNRVPESAGPCLLEHMPRSHRSLEDFCVHGHCERQVCHMYGLDPAVQR